MHWNWWQQPLTVGRKESELNRKLIFLAFFVLCGLAICLTVFAGHPRVAASEFVCLVLIGSFLPFWLRQNQSTNPSTNESKKGRGYFWLAWFLILGAILEFAVQCAKVFVYKEKLVAGPFIEFLVELLLAFFLLDLARRKSGNVRNK